MGVAMVTWDGLPMRIWLRTWLAIPMLAVVMLVAFAVGIQFPFTDGCA